MYVEEVVGVNMITDVLYSVNLYIRFCVKRFELSHVMDIAPCNYYYYYYMNYVMTT